MVKGGKREGAGRPAYGVTKKVSITLKKEDWEIIQDKINNDNEEYNSFSDFFRKIYYEWKGGPIDD